MAAMRAFPAACLVSVVFLCACVTSSGPGDVERVRAALEDLVQAQNEGNVPLLLSFFSDDAVLIPPSGPAIRGISGIADHYRQLVGEQQIESAIRIDEIETAGNLAWGRARVVGYLTSRSTSGETRIDDEWLAVLRRSGGEWQLARLMWREAD